MLRAVSPKEGERVISVHLATDDHQCSRIGMDFLREGGNAVDASVVAALCLEVVPASSGLGAELSCLISMLANETPKCKGALSGAILGELAGHYETWKHGWKGFVGKTCKTCCSSARLGFMISPYLHMQMVKTKSGTLADEGLRHIFTLNGTLLKTDPQENAISMTSTVNGYFGVHVLSSGTGIVLNNEMDFSIPRNDSTSQPPARTNFIRPGKRPLSSMTPAIVLKVMDDRCK
ncbi:hypothetical protein TB2_002360 [Malus domestica]